MGCCLSRPSTHSARRSPGCCGTWRRRWPGAAAAAAAAAAGSTPPPAPKLASAGVNAFRLNDNQYGVVARLCAPPAVIQALEKQSQANRWVSLPQLWGGYAAIPRGHKPTAADLRSVLLTGLPFDLCPDWLTTQLREVKWEVSSYDRPVDPATGFPCLDRLTVSIPASSILPTAIILNIEGEEPVHIAVHPLSALPPPPAWPQASPAAPAPHPAAARLTAGALR